MHYGHIASDMGASICERSLLHFVIIRVLMILHTIIPFGNMIGKRQSFCKLRHDLFFSLIDVVYKSNYNLKTNRQNWINVILV